jgi:hypothetical protein
VGIRLVHLRDKSAGRSSELTNERALAKEQRDAWCSRTLIIRATSCRRINGGPDLHRPKLSDRAGGRPEELPNAIEATRVSLRLGQFAGSRHHQLNSGQLLFCQSNCYGVIPIIDRFHGLQEEVAILRGH